MSDNHEPPADWDAWHASPGLVAEAEKSASETHDTGSAPEHSSAAQDNDGYAVQEEVAPGSMWDELSPEKEEFWDDNFKPFHYSEQFGGYIKVSEPGQFPTLICRRPKAFYSGPRKCIRPEEYSQLHLRHGQSGGQLFPAFVSAKRSQAFRDQCRSAGFVCFNAEVDGFESLKWALETVDAKEKDAGEDDAGDEDAGDRDAGNEDGEGEEEAGKEEDNEDLVRLTIPDDSAKGFRGTACLLEDTAALPTMVDLA
jgi:hypothetical protein